VCRPTIQFATLDLAYFDNFLIIKTRYTQWKCDFNQWRWPFVFLSVCLSPISALYFHSREGATLYERAVRGNDTLYSYMYNISINVIYEVVGIENVVKT